MSERVLAQLRKAWMAPDGTIHEVEGEHHMQWWERNGIPTIPYYLSGKYGWVRLTRRGLALDVEGSPDKIEIYKDRIINWSGPHTQWVNIDPNVKGFVQRPIESSFETFSEDSLARMMQTARLTGATVFRRRPVRVRQHIRHRTFKYG